MIPTTVDRRENVQEDGGGGERRGGLSIVYM